MSEFIHIVKENVLTWCILFRCGGVAEWSLAATEERPFRRNSATSPQRKPVLSRPGVCSVFNCASWFVRSLRPIGLAAFDLPYRSASEINAVGIMHQAVENAIGQRWIADLGVPFGDRHLAGKDLRRLERLPHLGQR